MNKHFITSKYLDPVRIRNFCIIAHVDHGKSTLADWLISSAKIISEQPGRRYLDSREDEKKRGITIKSASISFVLNEHTFNLIDSPGHADFGGNVTTALRACDGALLLIDAVEGMMPQTLAVLKQAIKQNVVPVLFINKIDRLFVELRLSADEIQKRLVTLVQTVNEYITSLEPHSCILPFAFKTGNILLGAGLEGWALNLAHSNFKLGHVLKYYSENKAHELKSVMPIADIVSSTIITHIPGPQTAQKYKLERIGQHIPDLFLQPLIDCNPLAKVTCIVTGITYSSERGKLVSARVFSGTVKKGMVLYSSVSADPMTVSRLCLFVGKNIEEYQALSAGMLVVLTGLGDCIIGCTLSEDPAFPAFEELKHSAEPVMAVSFSPLNQTDLTRVRELMYQECMQDMTLKYEFNQNTKEHILKGLGKLHIEIVLNRIVNEEKIPLDIKNPSVIYLETITGMSETQEAITSNRLNKFKLYVMALDENTSEVINQPNLLKVPNFHKLFVNTMLEPYAKKIVAVEGKNVCLNVTKSVQFMQETLPNVLAGFRKSVQQGPLLGKTVVNTAVFLTDATWHVDFVHRSPQDIAPPTTKLIHKCMTSANPAILEPYIKTYITVPLEYMNEINKQIKVNNGRVMDIEYSTDSVLICGQIPVKNSFYLSEQFMKASEGKLSWRYDSAKYDYMDAEATKLLIETEGIKN